MRETRPPPQPLPCTSLAKHPPTISPDCPPSQKAPALFGLIPEAREHKNKFKTKERKLIFWQKNVVMTSDISELFIHTGRRERRKDERDEGFYSRASAGARGTSLSHARARTRARTPPVFLTEDTVSVDANASQLGSQPKALSGIEFHQTSFNQQVFKVRITLPLLQPRWPRLKQTQAGARLS